EVSRTPWDPVELVDERGHLALKLVAVRSHVALGEAICVRVVVVGGDLEAGRLERVSYPRGPAEQIEHAAHVADGPRHPHDAGDEQALTADVLDHRGASIAQAALSSSARHEETPQG